MRPGDRVVWTGQEGVTRSQGESGEGESLLRPSPVSPPGPPGFDLPEEDLVPLRTQRSVAFAKAWTTQPRMGASPRRGEAGRKGPSREKGTILAVTRGLGGGEGH